MHIIYNNKFEPRSYESAVLVLYNAKTAIHIKAVPHEPTIAPGEPWMRIQIVYMQTISTTVINPTNIGEGTCILAT